MYGVHVHVHVQASPALATCCTCTDTLYHLLLLYLTWLNGVVFLEPSFGPLVNAQAVIYLSIKLWPRLVTCHCSSALWLLRYLSWSGLGFEAKKTHIECCFIQRVDNRSGASRRGLTKWDRDHDVKWTWAPSKRLCTVKPAVSLTPCLFHFRLTPLSCHQKCGCLPN